jgi:hypothetical protein
LKRKREKQKSDNFKESCGDDHYSLTLSQSADSDANNEKVISRSVNKYPYYNHQLEASKNKKKRVSQGSSCSNQNNRYNKPFEGDRSGVSGSFGGGLLESSRLITDDYISPNHLRTHRNLSKYLNKSEKKSPPINQDLIHEQLVYNAPNLKESIESIMKSSPTLNEHFMLRNQAQERYSATRLQEPEETLQYNQTFSTFGVNEDYIPESCTKEDRFRPARICSNHSSRNVYQRLYQPNRRDKVRFYLSFYRSKRS